MDIGVSIKELGEVDTGPLVEAVSALSPEAWDQNLHRQKSYHVHADTQSVVLVFCQDRWPELTVQKEAGWDLLADVVVPIMHDLIARHYPPGGTILRSMAAKLKAGGRISTHRDTLPSLVAVHRIHVPVTTNDKVRFMIDGQPHRLQVGQAYEVNNQKLHSVINRGDTDRITLIFDYLPPEYEKVAMS